MWWTYVAQAGLGLAGGSYYAGVNLWQDLCSGDEEPAPRAVRRAWGRFALSLYAALIAAPLLTSPTVALSGGKAPWPVASVVLGLFGQGVLATIRAAASSELKARLKAAVDVFFKGASDREP
jgi:hypothetical protein